MSSHASELPGLIEAIVLDEKAEFVFLTTWLRASARTMPLVHRLPTPKWFRWQAQIADLKRHPKWPTGSGLNVSLVSIFRTARSTTVFPQTLLHGNSRPSKAPPLMSSAPLDTWLLSQQYRSPR